MRTTNDRAALFSTLLERQHPMYVLRVSTLLDPSFECFRPHEELKAEGLLVEFEAWMEVLFCSHTWLRRSHPDNEAGVKLSLLRAVLRRAVEGTLDISPHWMSDTAKQRLRLRATDMRRLADGFVFVDFCSIPQADPEAQQRAIASLVHYVSSCTYFICLAGPWTHEDGSSRDDVAWSVRGWCRMEMTGNALSPTTKPIIVATSPTSIVTFPPGGTIGREWLVSARVGHGTFTVDAHKAALGPVLCSLIEARKRLALSEGDMTFYRVLHAASSWLLDSCGALEAVEEPYEDWMRAMRFRSASDDAQSTGLTPLHFAVMTGRVDLVAALLNHGAPIECAAKRENRGVMISAGLTPLDAAVQFARDGTIVELLLRRGANPRKRKKWGLHSLHYATGAGNAEGVRALMQHDATLADLPSDIGLYPFFMAPFFGQSRLTSILRDEFPDQFKRSVRNHDMKRAGTSLCATAMANGISSPDILNAILDAGEPVDRYIAKVTKGPTVSILRFADLIARLRPMDKLPSFVISGAYLTRSTALHVAAYHGMLVAVDLLVARGAPINSTAHPMGMTPLHLSTIGGHPDVVAWLLEKGADGSIKDKRGRTSLAYATRLRREAVRPLLMRGSRTEAMAPSAEPMGSPKVSVAPQRAWHPVLHLLQ